MAKFTQEEVDARIFTAGVDVYVEDETLVDCAQDTWYSPSTGSLSGLLQDKFDYTGGQIVYSGDEDITVIVIANTSFTVDGGGLAADVETTNGKNNSPCDIGIMPGTSTLGGAAMSSTICIFPLSTGDTIDFFIRQTSETGTPDITIEKGRYTILKIG